MRNQPRSIRGSPTVQISQSMIAVISTPSASRLPSRKSPCTIAAGMTLTRGCTQRRRRRPPSPVRSAASTVSRSRHQRSISSWSPTSGSSPSPMAAGSSRCSAARSPSGVAHPLGHTSSTGSSPSRSKSGSSELPVEEGHDEQGRHLGWAPGVLEEHLGHGHPAAFEGPHEPSLAEHVAVQRRLDARRGDLDDHPAALCGSCPRRSGSRRRRRAGGRHRHPAAPGAARDRTRCTRWKAMCHHSESMAGIL